MSLDLYTKDTTLDFGLTPSAGDPLWVSPDIIPRKNQVVGYGNPGMFPAVPATDDIEQGRDNFVYVRINTRTTNEVASGVNAKVYYSEPSTLPMPSGWNLVGSTAILSPSGGTVIDGSQFPVVGEIRWPSASIPATGHYCFVSSIWSEDDPEIDPNTIGSIAFSDWVRSQNNISWRNFNVAAAAKVTPALPKNAGGVDPSRFNFYRVWANTPSAEEDLVMRLGILSTLPRGSYLEMEGDKEFLDRINPRRRATNLIDVVTPALSTHAVQPDATLMTRRGILPRIERFNNTLTHRLPIELGAREGVNQMLLSPTVFHAKKHHKVALNIWVPKDAMNREPQLSLHQDWERRPVGGVTWILARPAGR